jgi:hypothetical protein
MPAVAVAAAAVVVFALISPPAHNYFDEDELDAFAAAARSSISFARKTHRHAGDR